MIAVQKIALDIIRSNKCKVIRSKQGDCLTRFAEITVTKEGEVVFVPNNITVLVNVKRADDAQRIYVGSVNDNGTVQIPINTWMNEVAGIGQLDISLLDGETKLSTMYVQFDVDEGACAHMQDDEGGDVITHVIGELDKKIDKVDGMGLSSNDYTNEDKELLHSFESNINTIKVNGEEQKIVGKVVDICVPTRINELENDSDFANQDYVTNEISKEAKERISADKAINEILSSFSKEIEQNKKDITDLHIAITNHQSDLEDKQAQIDDLQLYLEDVPQQKIIKNVTIPVLDFVEDDTFEDYPYRADISIDDVSVDDYANISFALADVQSKNYASICTTDDGKISIYAVEAPLSDITIPLIEVIKV